MMTNLFSVFDPCTGLLSLNWMSTIIFLMIMPFKFWLTPNKNIMIYKFITESLSKEIKMIMPHKGILLIMLSMFLFILINNFMGLAPYVFTSSSHLVFSLTMALPLWLAFILYGWINKPKSMFTHLVPLGTPAMLTPFMVMIETVSNLIRPGSLAVRLTANMIAGHLLMSLLGGTQSIIIMISTMIIFVTLMLFEMAVSTIQAYVFMTLSTLYSSEI
uniref:ATP synthase subunit a n=1 Tax=Empoascanara sipra TaxID=2716871 RepID=A0A6M3Q6C7_9HEMI|nr:ATP synthase F0 subunit 6 [Empoascanara sipra]QJC14412.1 ATP synthase F0 subunit 6 [Empoascanara sipra]QUI77236.1 ATP synthase F0 subunit 6 [Empoascanara wengangensis]